MQTLLQIGQKIALPVSGSVANPLEYLGDGTQGEVYKVEINGKAMALKWLKPDYLETDPGMYVRLEKIIDIGPPSNAFLWPLEMLECAGIEGFGYIMPLYEEGFVDINALMTRKAEPTFKVLVSACFEVVQAFWMLHSQGLCYRDISFKNVFFNPKTGAVRICDNDNVDVVNEPGVIAGTPSFMATEIVAGSAQPTTETDLHSLAVLIFYMLMVHHPLEGTRELSYHAFDYHAAKDIYGKNALYIFDPNDSSNQPVPGYHDNALAYKNVYPAFLMRMFEKAFVSGLHNPQHRVRETEWREVLAQLRDQDIYCSHCGVENFYDQERLTDQGGYTGSCWNCGGPITLPPRIRLNGRIVLLNHDTALYAHHLDNNKTYDFSKPLAKVIQNPKNPTVWGIKNMTEWGWVKQGSDGHLIEIEPGESLVIANGVRANLSGVEAVIAC